MRTLEELYAEIKAVPDFSSTTIEGPRTKNFAGDTPLHIVSVWGDCEAIKLLVEAGAEINCPGEDLLTPLHNAVEQEKVEAAKLLIELGAVPSRTAEGDLPSELAENLGYEAFAAELKEQGF